VVTVEVRSRRDGVSISVPQRANVVGSVETERISMLSEAIKVGIVWQIDSYSPILAFENDRCASRIEQDLTRALPDNRE